MKILLIHFLPLRFGLEINPPGDFTYDLRDETGDLTLNGPYSIVGRTIFLPSESKSFLKI